MLSASIRPRGTRPRTAAQLATCLGAALVIEAVFDAHDPEAEVSTLLDAISAAEACPKAVLVAPRREFKTRPSATLPPGEHPVAELVSALRRRAPSMVVGAGTPSHFTEFSRNPPGASADFVYFGTSGIVHAADDTSVMETVSAYPAIVESARRLCPDRPIWLGPCTIGARHNPYGADVVVNPDRRRVPSARCDPRHRALFAAAFVTAVASQASAAGVEHLIFASPSGDFELLDAGTGRRLPLCAIQAELAAAAGAQLVSVTIDHPGIAGLIFRTERGLRGLVANLTPDRIEIIPPVEFPLVSLLTEKAVFVPVASNSAPFTLPGYRVALIEAGI